MWYLAGPKAKGPTVVLLHGFATDKEQWVAVARLLFEAGYHVIAPDLPGFGANFRDEEGKYDATSMAKQLRSFARGAGLGLFHLVGHGTGATVAASYAYGMPSELATVTLIEPLGLSAPGESDLDKMVSKGRNPLVPATPQAYDHMLGFVTTTPPPMSGAVKKKRAETLAANREFYTRVWADLREGDRAHLLDLLLPEIKVRMLVMFGAKSRVVHASTAKMAEKRLEGRDARVTVLPDTGHWLVVEKPKEVVEALISFWKAPAERREKKAAPEATSSAPAPQ
jgi:pimeloyl-ACP methyl ester carboxylesterase